MFWEGVGAWCLLHPQQAVTHHSGCCVPCEGNVVVVVCGHGKGHAFSLVCWLGRGKARSKIVRVASVRTELRSVVIGFILVRSDHKQAVENQIYIHIYTVDT